MFSPPSLPRRRKFSRTNRSEAALCMIALFFLPFVTAAADRYTVSESVYRTLTEAGKQLHGQGYASALETLDSALASRRLNDYEHALLQRLAGETLIALSDYAAAAQRFEAALGATALPDDARERLQRRLAQLYLHEMRYDDALAALREQVSATAGASGEACFLVASAYAGLERFSEALEWGERGLAKLESPGERDLELLATLNLVSKRYTRAAELLERLVERHPTRARHWRRLSAAYVALNRLRRALAVAELGHLQEALTSDQDVGRLANLYLHLELPYQAAALLEDALKAGSMVFDAGRYRLLADAWVAAREYARAVAPLKEAAKRLRTAGETGEEADARLLLGTVYARLERYSDAERELRYCLKFDATRDVSGQWLAYIK